jgi:hypothetical protein
MAGDANYYLKVAVTGTGAYTGTVTSPYTGPVTTAGTGQVITAIAPITGITQVWGVLTAGTLTPYGATATYQWQRSSAADGPYANIPGATGKHYTVAAGDKGYYIRVVATGSGYYSGTVINSSISTVAANAAEITAISDITGTAAINQTLKAGNLMPSSATVLYQWQIADTADGIYTDINGATGATYTLTPVDAGKYIRVLVTGIGAYTGTVASRPIGPVVETAIEITAMEPISGNVKVGYTLKAGALTPADATATYEWRILTEPGGLFAVIPGATSDSYTLGPEEYNYYIQVIATGTGSYFGTVQTHTTVKVAKLEITGFAAIPDLLAGTVDEVVYANSAEVIAALPVTVVANTLNGGTVAVPVKEWMDTDTYDPNTAGSYTFTAVLDDIPEGYSNDEGFTATIEVVIAPPAQGKSQGAPGEAQGSLVLEEGKGLEDMPREGTLEGTEDGTQEEVAEETGDGTQEEVAKEAGDETQEEAVEEAGDGTQEEAVEETEDETQEEMAEETEDDT